MLSFFGKPKVVPSILRVNIFLSRTHHSFKFAEGLAALPGFLVTSCQQEEAPLPPPPPGKPTKKEAVTITIIMITIYHNNHYNEKLEQQTNSSPAPPQNWLPHFCARTLVLQVLSPRNGEVPGVHHQAGHLGAPTQSPEQRHLPLAAGMASGGCGYCFSFSGSRCWLRCQKVITHLLFSFFQVPQGQMKHMGPVLQIGPPKSWRSSVGSLEPNPKHGTRGTLAKRHPHVGRKPGSGACYNASRIGVLGAMNNL